MAIPRSGRATQLPSHSPAVALERNRILRVASAFHQAPPANVPNVTQYIYKQSGSAVGFVRGRYIHAMNGTAVGQLRGTHVHKLSGSYVGELDDDTILDKRLGNLGNIGNPGNPGNPGSPGNPGNRGNRGYRGFRDVSSDLFG
jgi:hypothetical protein